MLNRRSHVRFRHKLNALENAFLAGELEEPALQQRATALVAFTRTPGVFGWAFRQAVLESLPVSGHRPRTG